MHSSCSDGFVLCLFSMKGELLQVLQDWTAHEMTACGPDQDLECRDKKLALHLKLVALLAILLAGAAGVTLPLLGRKIKSLRSDGTFFAVAKAFAAGVILATGFVHMLPDGMESLTNECLPEYPWGKFPFSGCIAMLAAMGTLLIDVLGTEYYEKKHTREQKHVEDDIPTHQPEREKFPSNINDIVIDKDRNTHTDHMHVLGMHAHAASHGHSHPHGHHSCSDDTHDHVNGHIGISHMQSSQSDDASADIRHVVISQVLELGIVMHSVIIGITLGVSQSPCTIRPLMAALSFHQCFEGFALGGCISQAGFKSLSSILMACSFAITTPSGIAIGIGISSSFNSNSPRALVVEGIFDSISAGILVYMSLVDLIAADFLSKRMCCNRRLQVLSYIALFLGAATMSALAFWI